MAIDLYALKRNRLKAIQGQETVPQVEHIHQAGAKLVMSDVIVPGDVITTDTSAAGVLVKVGSICRIQVTSDTYVAFGPSDTMAAVTSATTPGLKLVGVAGRDGVYLVVATDDFIRTSAAVTRLEVLGLTDTP